ncbi:MAG: cytochrome b [Xanthomonadales bacterium]|nr:cytochrome b [Xanthomonadales bacterium]
MPPLRDRRERWGLVSVAIHWLTVAGILFMGVLGLYMKALPIGAEKVRLYALHKSIGISLLALTLLRLLWRVLNPRPSLPPMPRWQRLAAHASHGLLYLLLLAVPLAGWVMNSAANFPLVWFGILELPAIAAPSQPLRALAGQLHEALFWSLVLLALLHAAAAFKHHLVDRDEVLRRMLGLGPRHGRR